MSMKHFNRPLLVVLVVLVVLAACDSPTTTRRTVHEVSVTPGDLHLALNGTRTMTAEARDERGALIRDASVQWRSSNPSAVSVSPSGVVTAVAGGAAQITAAVNGLEGNALVSVAVPLPTTCSSVQNLQVGEVLTAPAGEGALLCFAGASGGAEYTMIPFYGSSTAGATVVLDVATRGAQAISSPLAASSTGTASAHAARATPEIPRNTEWELRLRQREIRDLTHLFPVAREVHATRSGAIWPNFSAASAVPAVGSLMTLNVNSQEPCRSPIHRTGEVMAVTQRAVVLADQDNPAGGFTQAEYDAFGRSFDEIIYPVVTSNFGSPSDIDGNGRILIFFTQAVNDLTTTNNSVIGGFFFSRDLFPRTGTAQQQACPESNEAEIVYLMVPDPTRAATQPAFSKENVQRTTRGVLAHEFQHLINAAERLFTANSVNFEETWLNEGLSHIAEELVGNHVAGFGRRENVDYQRVTSTTEAWSAFGTYHRANFNRLIEHLREPDRTAVLDPDAPLAARGAVWQFLRYAADRKDGPESAIWKPMVRTPSTGLRNLQNVLGVDPVEWLRDWSVAVYADDAVAGLPARFLQQGWHYRSVVSNLRVEKRFPLDTRSLPANGSTRLEIAAGGAAYLRFGVPAGGQAEIRTSSGGFTPPHRLYVSVVRTR
jgi:hypothetical protein